MSDESIFERLDDAIEVAKEAIALAKSLEQQRAELLESIADMLSYIDDSDTDDLDFGRGLSHSGLIERLRAAHAKAKGDA